MKATGRIASHQNASQSYCTDSEITNGLDYADPEPPRRDVPVGVTRPQAARVVLAVGAATGPVAAVGVAAVVTAAAAE